MGHRDSGQWVDDWGQEKKSLDGKFQRVDAGFRNWVTADGAPGPSGEGGFPAASGRYHLYVSWACPWAHRTLIFRALKGLEPHVGVSAVHWQMHGNGWEFKDGEGVIADEINGAEFMWQVYAKAKADYTGRASVPVLWDRERATIVSNESSEIIRMFNSAFDGLEGVDAARDFYPEHLRPEIDRVNERVYETINNGVYRSGFAMSQEAYGEAVTELFETMEWLEGLLAERRYIAGDQITEADWRLFPTLIRFDPVYHGHFKCNRKRLIDYPNLWAYTRELYQWPGVKDTTNHVHIKHHYYGSHITVNPTLIVPKGPEIDFDAPHDRERLAAAA